MTQFSEFKVETTGGSRIFGDLNGMTDKIKKEIPDLLKQNAVGLMYDLIGATMPFPKGDEHGGGTLSAFEQGIKNFRLTVNKAFKPIQAIPFGVLAVNRDIKSMLAYGFKFESDIAKKEFNENKFEAIYNMFHNAGFEPDSQYKIIDDATMDLLVEYRSKHPTNRTGNNKYDPHYVRNVETIEKLKRAKNQVKVGAMAGGWLKCALQLGGKQDKYTKERKPLWMYHKGAGFATVTNDGNSITCTNKYGNFGGWTKSSGFQDAMNLRYRILDQMMKELLNKLEK